MSRITMLYSMQIVTSDIRPYVKRVVSHMIPLATFVLMCPRICVAIYMLTESPQESLIKVSVNILKNKKELRDHVITQSNQPGPQNKFVSSYIQKLQCFFLLILNQSEWLWK